ncbi:hypothetical protein [Gimesia sp.]|uniref:hypothetical protein n=1 Tax=Gimesia sp. TaxID=2024833 RepID=UPI003A8F84DB
MTHVDHLILVYIDSDTIDLAPLNDLLPPNLTIETRALGTKVSIPPKTIGAVLQAHESAVDWMTKLQFLDIPVACFISDEGNNIDLELDLELMPEPSLGDAFTTLLELIQDRSSENQMDDSSPVEPESFDLVSLVKARLQSAMYRGDRIDDDQQSWQSENYDRHIQTLLTTICEPVKSQSKTTFLDLASCVLAARLTKHFISYRYKQPYHLSKQRTTPPGLSTPTESIRKLLIGWDGLFTLIFSLVDFIEDNPDGIEFKFKEFEADPEWVALTINRLPDFNTPPSDFRKIPLIGIKYCELAKSTLIDDEHRANKLWKYSTEENQVILKLYAPSHQGTEE